MIDAGMGSFTLPQFIEWWHFKDGSGKYANQQVFKDAQPNNLETVLGHDRFFDYQEGEGNFIIDAWRFQGRNVGKYERYAVNQGSAGPEAPVWEYYNDNPDASAEEKDNYSFSDLQINDVKAKTFNRITKLFDNFITQGVYAADLIALNDYYNIVGFDPEKEIDNASKQFIKDIRRSKNAGYVQWKNTIALNLRLIEGAEPCVVQEEFTFRLYLYNKKKPLDTTKSSAVPFVKIAAPATGADGTNKLGSEDGESDAVADNSPNSKVGGELKTRFRSYDGAFAAGSEQIYGIVHSDNIPGANLPDLDPDNMDVKEHFEDPIASPQITPGTGIVIPIDIQNSNPFQWAPNYKNPRSCRGDDKEKVKLQVFNMNPRSYKKGDYVKITDRESLWWIDELAVGEEEVVLADMKDVSEWQFTYHITNQRYHFRFADPNAGGQGQDQKQYDVGLKENAGPVDAFAMEDAIAKKYLAARTTSEWTGKYGPRVAHQVVDEGKTWPGYAQITSFDYMGEEFGGLRGSDGNALVLTDNRRSYDGTLFAQFDDRGKACGKWTMPFFGCTFPKGYNDEAKYTNLNSAVKDAEGNLTGRGWRPGANTENSAGSSLSQDDSFFDLSQFQAGGPYGVNGDGFAVAGETQGIFNPADDHNNRSSNISPTLFLTQEERDAITDKYVNLFSAGHQMYHVPADVLTNGPFSAENGGPILNLNNVQKYITDPDVFGTINQYPEIHNSYHDFWLDPTSFQFLYDTVDRATNQDYEKDDKAILDFKPVDTNNVLFRPLRDSVYAQWDQKIGGSFGNEPFPVSQLSQCGFSNYGQLMGGLEYTVGLTNITTGQPIFGTGTKVRIWNKDEKSGKHHLIVPQVSTPYEDQDLINSIIVQPAMPFEYSIYKNADKLGSAEFKKEGFAVAMANSLFYGSNTPDALGASKLDAQDEQTMGGFGVIGAKATCECEGGFVFVADTYIGQDAIFNFVVNQHEAMLGSKTQLLYNQASTTQLFVKVYQAWPRDQTIFDSRFFAVHHFNEGNKFPVGEGSQRPWDVGYRSAADQDDTTTFPGYTLKYDTLTEEPTGVKLKRGEASAPITASGLFAVDKVATNVDIREPSKFGNQAFTFSQNEVQIKDDFIEKVTSAQPVFNEGVFEDDSRPYVLEDDGTTLTHIDLWAEQFPEADRAKRKEIQNKFTPIAPTGYWKVNNDRRGRLLPWIYKQSTIRLPEPLRRALNVSNVPPETTLADLIKEEEKYIILHDLGEDYNINDTLKIESATGFNAIARVAATGEGGSIQRLEWTTKDVTILGETVNYVYRGEGFLPSDFPAGSTTGINEDTKSDLEFLPHLNFEGSGYTNRSFKGYMMAGSLEDVEKWDYKPQVATEIKEPYVLGTPNNTVDGTSNPVFRNENNFAIIPFTAQAIILGHPSNTFFTVPQENIEPTIGRQVTTVVLSGDPSVSNPNVLSGRFPKFDMFFQFHGDISHQGIAGGANKPSFFENFIDLSVKPF
jgi:hypothetical protein